MTLKGEELHNIFNRLCDELTPDSGRSSDIGPYESGKALELKSRLKSGDNLDIHHVPDKYLSMRQNKEYDPNSGPAIVLSKNEHRQICGDSLEKTS